MANVRGLMVAAAATTTVAERETIAGNDWMIFSVQFSNSRTRLLMCWTLSLLLGNETKGVDLRRHWWPREEEEFLLAKRMSWIKINRSNVFLRGEKRNGDLIEIHGHEVCLNMAKWAEVSLDFVHASDIFALQLLHTPRRGERVWLSANLMIFLLDNGKWWWISVGWPRSRTHRYVWVLVVLVSLSIFTIGATSTSF